MLVLQMKVIEVKLNELVFLSCYIPYAAQIGWVFNWIAR